jgi:hypothetical protein
MIISRAPVLLLLFVFSVTISTAQTKTYLTGGFTSYSYKTKDEALTRGKIKAFFYGLEVDHYVSYHYAISTGAFYLHGGYDNGPSKWDNTFIQVPLGIKAASLGDVLGITVGVNLNYLLKSTLREVADTLGNYVSTDVTKACPKLQPDFFFGILIRRNRVTLLMKPSFSLTNRYSTKVKEITDRNNVYYGSWYAYVLARNDHKLKASGTQISLSIRLF